MQMTRSGKRRVVATVDRGKSSVMDDTVDRRNPRDRSAGAGQSERAREQDEQEQTEYEMPGVRHGPLLPKLKRRIESEDAFRHYIVLIGCCKTKRSLRTIAKFPEVKLDHGLVIVRRAFGILVFFGKWCKIGRRAGRFVFDRPCGRRRRRI